MNTHIRFARLQDTKEILSIYAPYVLHDSATFEYEVPSIETFKQRIQTIQQFYPYLVYEENNEILGYAYASRYKERKSIRMGCGSFCICTKRQLRKRIEQSYIPICLRF